VCSAYHTIDCVTLFDSGETEKKLATFLLGSKPVCCIQVVAVLIERRRGGMIIMVKPKYTSTIIRSVVVDIRHTTTRGSNCNKKR